jgi:hypothetical protein
VGGERRRKRERKTISKEEGGWKKWS